MFNGCYGLSNFSSICHSISYRLSHFHAIFNFLNTYLLKAKAVVVPKLQRPFFMSECKAEEGGLKRTNHTVVSPKLDRTKT